MLNKSSHHQNENTYTFKTFSERLAGININIVHTLKKVSTVPEDSDTFFGEALAKWSDLNCTEHYIQFYSDIRHQVNSFSQLIHHQNAIVAALEKHLVVTDSLALEPLFDLVVQLARDLQVDFYVHFSGLFASITNILKMRHHDAPILEQAFQTLAYVFKVLWKSMVADLDNVFDLFAPLLSNQYQVYINNFAAESFGFLMRKSRNVTQMFEMIIEKLASSSDKINGISRLFFEMIKGVQHKFHSSTEKVLMILFEVLDKNFNVNVEEMLISLFSVMTKYTTDETCDVIWTVLLKLLNIENHENDDMARIKLEIFNLWISFNDGRLTSHHTDKIGKYLIEGVRNGAHFDKSVHLLDCCVSYLLSGFSDSKLSTTLISQIFKCKYEKINILRCLKMMFSYENFKSEMQFKMLQYCDLHCKEYGESILPLLIDYLLFLEDEETELIDIGLFKKLQGWMLLRISNSDISDSELFSLAFLCRHCEPFEKKRLLDLVKAKYRVMIDRDDINHCILNELVLLINNLMSSEKFMSFINVATIQKYVSEHYLDIYCLKVASFYYKKCAENGDSLNESQFLEIYQYLKFNLSSHQSQIRKLTLEILCNFQLELKTLPKNMELEQCGIFQLCLDAESIQISFHECRTKIMHLRKLDVNVIEYQLPVKHCDEVVIRYLLGLLRVNFKMIWPTISELIANYATHLDGGQFWPLYFEHLEFAALKCEETLYVQKKKSVTTVHESQKSRHRYSVAYEGVKTDDHLNALITDLEDVLQEYMTKTNKLEKYDPIKNRTLLWTAMLQFIPLVESKSRQISPLLFDFLEKEYYAADDGDEEEGVAKTQDIRPREAHTRSKFIRRRASNKLLVEHLTVFSRFRGPKSVYLQPRLTTLYHDLLQHLDKDVQTVALQCIFSYKHKYITPYKENFEKLLDEKTFNNELVLFTLTSEHNCPILEEHREGLIPILTRLLYGKMQVKTSNQKINLRKNKIIRFLAASEGRELATFMDLLFQPFKAIIEDEDCLGAINQPVDFSKIMPIKLQQGALFTIEIVLKKLAHLISDYLHNIISTLLILSSLATNILNERHLVHPPVINSVKNLRNGYLNCFEQIFQNFDTYEFSELQIEKLFDAIVIPQVSKLYLEGLHCTSLLMKIFIVWSDHPRYHSLFSKTFTEEKSNILSFVFKLLRTPGCAASVKDTCMLIVENLLTTKFEDDDEDKVMLPVGETDIPLQIEDDLRPLGLRLILRHRAIILDHLKTVVVEMVKPGQLKKKKNIPTRELNILLKFSEHVNEKDIEQITTIVELMFPFLSKNLNRDDSVEYNILLIITNLLPKIPNAISFMGTIARLFSNLQSRSSRKQLCILVQSLVKVAPELENAANIITQLNSWDGRRIDEPDYAARLENFKIIIDSLKSQNSMENFDLNLMLMTSMDMSLRDMSSYCLQQLIEAIKRMNDPSTFEVVILRNILAEIKAGVKAKTQSSRDEYVRLLARLVRTFPECSSFNELLLLTDAEDVEVDFFENIVHIQVHRRSRALRRLCKVIEETHIRRDTLMHFLLPIATSYIRDPCYTKQHNLIETAVDTIGSICKSLPWRPYLEILEKYLKMLTLSLENQRLMVKIIVAVLSGFHFDLSNSKSISELMKKSKPKKIGEEILDIDEPKVEDKKKENEDVDMEEPKGDKEADEDVDMAEESVPEITRKTPAFVIVNGKMLVEPIQAERIYFTIVKKILPELHKCITNKTKQDGEHKRVKDKYAADEEVLRVPIALAMVHLLQMLPSFMLRTNLPGILMKVCKFIQHRALDIRNIARDTLYKICLSLGGSYLNVVIRELSSALTRGYQKHVLSFTVHGLLVKMDDILKGEHVDTCLKPMIKIFNNELFGEVSQEKEVQGIVSKLMEARSSKSIESYRLLSSKILNHSVEELIIPFKEILLTTTSHKRIRKVAEVLKAVGHGLTCSRGHHVDKVTLMSLIYSLMKSCTVQEPAAVVEDYPMIHSEQKKISLADRRPESCLVVPKAPGRIGIKPKQSFSTNNSILAEFSLQLLYFLLKKEELSPKNLSDLELLDPFVELLTNSLNCKHIQLTTLSLQCFCWMLRMQLPSFVEHQKQILDNLFIILNEFASFTIQGDKFDLIIITFKTITIMLRDVKRCKLNNGQLEILLGYIENDIYDDHKRSTAFTLLKAILTRKLQIPAIHEVLLKIEQQSIVGECSHNRLQCRQVLLQYLLYYPVGDDLVKHLEFFVTQLNYELESGRQSSLEMLALIFSHFPLNVITEHSGFFYVPLVSRLTKDESAKCRTLTSLAISSLLSKLEKGPRNDLYTMNLQWMSSYKSTLRRLASMSCNSFVEVESADFASRLRPTLDLLVTLIDKDKFDHTDMPPEQEKLLDLELFNHLSLLLKICQHCDILKNPKYAETIDNLFDNIEVHLLHGHHWVRLVSSQLFGSLFSTDPHPFLSKTRKISRLSEIACIQIAGQSLSAELSEQIIKNSVFIAKKLRLIENNDPNVKQRDLQWMTRSFCRQAGNEAINEPLSIVRRRSIFNWIAAVFMTLDSDQLIDYLNTVLPTLQRECKQLENDEAGELETHAREVMEVLKGIVGVEEFTKAYAACQKCTLDKRSERKKKKAENVISNPEIAVRKKIKKNLAKSEAKKRKIESYRPTKIKRTRNN